MMNCVVDGVQGSIPVNESENWYLRYAARASLCIFDAFVTLYYINNSLK